MSAPPARGQPAMKARKLGSSVSDCQPGSAAKLVCTYCARSGAGFAAGQTGQGFSGSCAQPALSTISSQAKRAMWVVYLEIIVALLIAAGIVWLTWPRKPK
jgi:hypothetical protein